MKQNCEGINVPTRYFSNLGPWVVDIFKEFTLSDLDVRDFGPKHCLVIQDENKMDSEGSPLKVVTDGEVLINAIFTLSSLHDFNQKSSNESMWQNKVLMLEKFKVTHIAGVNEIGDIAIKVEKFCCIGEPKYTANKFPFQLYWAVTAPAVKQACQKIWEDKFRLDEASETMELSELPLWDSTAFTSVTGNSFLPGIRSARNVLIVSDEERQILSSLPGWSKEDNRSTVKEYITTNEEISNKDAVSQKTLVNECSKNKKRQPLKISASKNEVKHSNHLLNMGNNIISEDNHISRTKCGINTQGNKLCLTQNSIMNVVNMTPLDSGNCAYSLIKQNFEKEEQRLMNLQQSYYPFAST